MSEPTLVPRIDDPSPLTIDYSVVAIEEIRAEVAQGQLDRKSTRLNSSH